MSTELRDVNGEVAVAISIEKLHRIHDILLECVEALPQGSKEMGEADTAADYLEDILPGYDRT